MSERNTRSASLIVLLRHTWLKVFRQCFKPAIVLVLTATVVGVLLPGCATKTARKPKLPVSHPPAFRKIVLVEDPRPATFSFQKAKGKLGSAKEAIWDSAELGLSGPGAGVIATGQFLSGDIGSGGSDGDPIFYAAAAGVVGGVTAVGAALAGPVVGTQGLIRSMKTISPAELAEREKALTKSLGQMSAQGPFHAALLQAGSERFRDGFISPEPKDFSIKSDTAADALLQARIIDLKLERAGSSEGSYFLRIKAHARITRSSDAAAVHDETIEYRSGTALFLDWTLRGALESVAETGFRALADYFLTQLRDAAP